MTQNPGQSAGTPPFDSTGTDRPPAGPEPSALDRFFLWLRGLDVRRDTQDKWLAGVCSGVANRLRVDPLVIRAVLVVLILMGGIGVTLYLIAWAFVPNEREEIVAERGIRDGDVGAIILLVLIVLALLGGSGFIDGGGFGLWWLWWVVVPIGVVVWLVTRNRANPSPAGLPATAATMGYPNPVGTTHPAGSRPPSSTVPLGAGPASVTGPSPAGPTGPTGPTGPWAPSAPVRPVPPPRPRRRGAGFLAALVAGGLAMAAYGLMVWAHRELGWAGDEHVVGLASALAVLGTSVLALGLAGFRTGLTGFLAVVLALVTWTAAVVPSIDVGGGVGDREWRPTGERSTESYRLGIGSANLRLDGYPTDPATPGTVNARVGVGELRIYVPEDLTVEVRSEVDAGEIREAGGWGLDDSGTWTQDGPGGRNLSTTERIGQGSTDLVVNASVGLGTIIIGKE